MFFIGIFGVEDKQKEIRQVNTVSCKSCSGKSLTLIKQFSFFHIFFIPLFKWNEKYFLICNNCNAMYEISKEKGIKIEQGEDIDITYWDLNIVDNIYNETHIQSRCSNCGRMMDSSFEFCPYCGKHKNL